MHMVINLLLLFSQALLPAQVDKPFEKGEKRIYTKRRAQMVERLKKGRHPITDARVLKAFGTVPRHKYVLEQDLDRAYAQIWIRIGWGQTITDPQMVAWMTELIEVTETDRVLEIGTGSGYQASILAQLTPHVHTIEIVAPLARRSHKLLENMGLDKTIKFTIGDGYHGWKEHGPYDKIIVTCAADHIPVPLIQQLKPGGIMVIPVGPAFQRQKLYFVRKTPQGRVRKKILGLVEFVPLRRTKKK